MEPSVFAVTILRL